MSEIHVTLQTREPYMVRQDNAIAGEVFHVYGRGKKGDTAVLSSIRLTDIRIHGSVHPFTWEYGQSPSRLTLVLTEQWDNAVPGLLIEILGKRNS